MPDNPSRCAVPVLPWLAAGATILLLATQVCADVSSDQPGAILVFPKIVSDVSTETIVQVSNATGSRVSARCFYVNGAIDSGTGEPAWSVTDFQIALSRLQPTSWVAGEGLPAVPPDGRPRDLYPGPVPPVDEGFLGELRCVVVNDSESPISRNALTGEATLVDRTTHAARKYQAISVPGLGANNNDNTLLFNDQEYGTCPRQLLFNHFFDDAPDPVLNTPIRSTLTLVPCSEDLEHTLPGTATVQFEVFNEFEDRLSASLPVTCFQEIELSKIDGKVNPGLSIFNFAVRGTLVGQTRMRPVLDADTSHGHGVLAIAEEFRDSHQVGTALNLHFIGGNLQADVLVLPSPF